MGASDRYGQLHVVSYSRQSVIHAVLASLKREMNLSTDDRFTFHTFALADDIGLDRQVL